MFGFDLRQAQGQRRRIDELVMLRWFHLAGARAAGPRRWSSCGTAQDRDYARKHKPSAPGSKRRRRIRDPRRKGGEIGSSSRKITVLRDLSEEQFREHLRRSNDPGRRFVVNFSREAIFGTGVGHHSPIGGYLEAEGLVFVLDVNPNYRPWLGVRACSRRLTRATAIARFVTDRMTGRDIPVTAPSEHEVVVAPRRQLLATSVPLP
jgi:hypothetical protein